MKKRLFLEFSVGLMIIIGIITIISYSNQRTSAYNGSIIQPPPEAAEIKLTKSDGNSFQLSDLRGKVVLLAFGYTNCPDVCPATLAGFNQAISMLGEKMSQVKFVFITVDPEYDPPEFLNTYVTSFNPQLIGLSGSLTELESVWHEYGVAVIREEVLAGRHDTGDDEDMDDDMDNEHSEGDESDHDDENGKNGEEQAVVIPDSPDLTGTENVDIAHSSRVYAIDKNGLMRLTFPFGMQVEAMVEDIEQLLRDR